MSSKKIRICFKFNKKFYLYLVSFVFSIFIIYFLTVDFLFVLADATCGDNNSLNLNELEVYLSCPEGDKFVGYDNFIWEQCVSDFSSCFESETEVCCLAGYPCKYLCEVNMTYSDTSCLGLYCEGVTTNISDDPCSSACSPEEPEEDDCEISIVASSCSSSGGGDTVYPGETVTLKYYITNNREDADYTYHNVRGFGSSVWQTLTDIYSNKACVCDEPSGYWDLIQRTFSFSELYNNTDNVSNNIKASCDASEFDYDPCLSADCNTTHSYTDSCTLVIEPNPETPVLSHSGITETSIKWDWTHIRGEVTEYQIRDSDDTLLYNGLDPVIYCGGDVIGNDCSFTEPGLIANTLYSRRVRAINTYGNTNSNLDSATTLTGDPIPTGHIRIQGPSGIIQLAVISATDAIGLGRGVVKIAMTAGDTSSAAWLVETTDLEASPVRIMTPYGIKAWRELD